MANLTFLSLFLVVITFAHGQRYGPSSSLLTPRKETVTCGGPCSCSQQYLPQCASDGQQETTYANKCQFECAQRCNPNLRIRFDGVCARPYVHDDGSRKDGAGRAIQQNRPPANNPWGSGTQSQYRPQPQRPTGSSGSQSSQYRPRPQQPQYPSGSSGSQSSQYRPQPQRPTGSSGSQSSQYRPQPQQPQYPSGSSGSQSQYRPQPQRPTGSSGSQSSQYRPQPQYPSGSSGSQSSQYRPQPQQPQYPSSSSGSSQYRPEEPRPYPDQRYYQTTQRTTTSSAKPSWWNEARSRYPTPDADSADKVDWRKNRDLNDDDDNTQDESFWIN